MARTVPTYVEVHIVQTVPPANLNRDDKGNPKEAFFGGVRRSRVSDASWKRAARISFAETLGMTAAELGVRTKRIASQLTGLLTAEHHVEEPEARRLAAAVLAPLGIKASAKLGKEDESSYLFFYGNAQLARLADIAAKGQGLDDKALAAHIKDAKVTDVLMTGHPLDVALFGRMVADLPAIGIEGAVQVAHALSTHAVELEQDYLTAVDDRLGNEERGAGMIIRRGFNSATLYRYANVNVRQLADTLGSTTDAIEGAAKFVEALVKSMPTGHIHSYGHRTLPSFVAVAHRTDQPVNLVSAFEIPVRADMQAGIDAKSARILDAEHATVTETWGMPAAWAGHMHRYPDTAFTSWGSKHSFPALMDELRGHLAAHHQS